MNFVILSLVWFSSSTVEQLTEHTLHQKEGLPAAKADLEQLDFLVGEWAGTGFGAECDEFWGAPAGNCMLGTFRMVEDGELQFTEFCMIQKDSDNRILLRLKHFTAKFESWEEKDEYVSFPLIRIDGDTAYFEGLTYAKQPDGALKVWAAFQQEDGTYEEAEFHLEPVKRS